MRTHCYRYWAARLTTSTSKYPPKTLVVSLLTMPIVHIDLYEQLSQTAAELGGEHEVKPVAAAAAAGAFTAK